VFCGVGAAGASCAQQAALKTPIALTAATTRMVERKRANGIYSSPYYR